MESGRDPLESTGTSLRRGPRDSLRAQRTDRGACASQDGQRVAKVASMSDELRRTSGRLRSQSPRNWPNPDQIVATWHALACVGPMSSAKFCPSSTKSARNQSSVESDTTCETREAKHYDTLSRGWWVTAPEGGHLGGRRDTACCVVPRLGGAFLVLHPSSMELPHSPQRMDWAVHARHDRGVPAHNSPISLPPANVIAHQRIYDATTTHDTLASPHTRSSNRHLPTPSCCDDAERRT